MKNSDQHSSPSINLVANIYQALSTQDVQTLREIVTEDVTWNVTEGFPYSGIYTGIDNVLGNFFGRVMAAVDMRAVEKDNWIDAGQHVVVQGYYHLCAKGETEEHRVRYAHVWSIKDGKVSGVWQVADSGQLPQARPEGGSH